MNEEQAVQVIIEAIAKLDCNQRTSLWERLMDGYCRHCGADLLQTGNRYKRCHCTNDD